MQRGPDGPFAYVVKDDATVEMRPLQLGDEAAAITIVATGWRDERVVTSNQYRLQAGARVQPDRRTRASAPLRHGAPRHAVMNISAPFIRRPIATSLLMAAIFLVGLVVYPAAAGRAAAAGRLSRPSR